jgi:hypothetical protein
MIVHVLFFCLTLEHNFALQWPNQPYYATLTAANNHIVLCLSVCCSYNSIVSGLQSSKWLDKKAALGKLATAITTTPTIAANNFAAVIVFLQENTKNFKDANVNVVKGAIDVVTSLVTAADTAPIDRPAIGSVLSVVTDKIGDRKLRDSIFALLTATAEATGMCCCMLHFITSRIWHSILYKRFE